MHSTCSFEGSQSNKKPQSEHHQPLLHLNCSALKITSYWYPQKTCLLSRGAIGPGALNSQAKMLAQSPRSLSLRVQRSATVPAGQNQLLAYRKPFNPLFVTPSSLTLMTSVQNIFAYTEKILFCHALITSVRPDFCFQRSRNLRSGG